jgi:hypothetical protein
MHCDLLLYITITPKLSRNGIQSYRYRFRVSAKETARCFAAAASRAGSRTVQRGTKLRNVCAADDYLHYFHHEMRRYLLRWPALLPTIALGKLSNPQSTKGIPNDRFSSWLSR